MTVTYHPDLDVLRRQMQLLPPECPKVVIDNASGEATVQALLALQKTVPRLQVVANTQNLGLAAALNQGIKQGRAQWPTVEYCLLLDQDSEPQPGSVQALWDAMDGLQRGGLNPGTVGPMLLDVETGLQHGFHQATRWRWRRIYPEAGSLQAVPCTNVNGSGSLVPVHLFDELGGLDEAFFIDHVDTEWAFRVLHHGYSLWGIPKAIFKHRMGQKTLKYWLFGWRVWPYRSPIRHYYLFRNAIWLVRNDCVPGVWRFWAVIKLGITIVVHGIFDSQRMVQLTHMWRGVVSASNVKKYR
ncbi:glycosyltransferase family 2 protein [Macromonas nakdongensis]|uniref:glycosyltransferase family 2 protein n=1 Tax=Macromonas nakdongensis TaxID=1843082 RepID=UPI0018E36AAD|nr:glycosyltransferase family 2 protein [Macromonas nakdongensis]